VAEAAKKLNLDPYFLLPKLRELGIYADDVQATIDLKYIPRVRDLLKTEERDRGQNYEERRVGTTVIRRRAPVRSKGGDAAPGPAGEPAHAEAAQEETPVRAMSVPVVEAVEVAATGEDHDEVAQRVQVDVAVEAPVAESPAVAEPGASAPEGVAESDDAVDEDNARIQRGPRRLSLRGVTPAPARVISRPVAPPPVAAAPEAKDKKPGETTAEGEAAKKSGRRVVEINQRDYNDRRRSKELVQQEMRAERHRKKKRDFKATEITTPKAIKRKIRIEGAILVGELAQRMGLKGGELIRKLFEMGQMCTINQLLDVDSATIIASEYGYEIENTAVEVEDFFEATGEETEEVLAFRHPVVTVMGHVDHGKTTLLDAMRETDVAGGEAGGITQAIGAYKVRLRDRDITFLDTPGHESFTSMRARGAHVTDIVVLVVAADDGVKPQTVEAINHAKDAKAPIVVAVNKIDKPDKNLERLYSDLAEHGLVQESWGGETQFALISAKHRENLDDLLEKILLQADIMDLKANADKTARGFVLEARLEKGRGAVATILVQEGTLKVGDPVVAGNVYGRVRFMHDDKGRRVDVAGPADPVEVVGLGGVPAAGDRFFVAESEKKAKQVAEMMATKQRELQTRRMARVSLESLLEQTGGEAAKELKVILKGDVQGSVEAVTEALRKLSTPQVKVTVVHSGVGGITETDINFAVASQAVVIGFNVRPTPEVRELADREGVQIKIFNIIYELLDEVTAGLEGLLSPIKNEVYVGRAEVRQTFSISKIGTIAGCYVVDGKIQRAARIRVIRDSVEMYSGKMSSLKRFKDDAREVATGFECGIQVENFNDVKLGDILECFVIEEVAAKLQPASAASS
ncbi:MAG: translation initiation factor IF-2, partial [Deltaproteobacteria bacterium]|nr:translation initiation factor IF-2 [Deltaproteobacteria bacterium]